MVATTPFDDHTGAGPFNAPMSSVLFRFKVLHFKRWRQKMEFFLTMREVVAMLTTERPNLPNKPAETETEQLHNWTEQHQRLQT